MAGYGRFMMMMMATTTTTMMMMLDADVRCMMVAGMWMIDYV